jgi:hypothetical protein
MSPHPILWKSPSPLWGRFDSAADAASPAGDDQVRPAILRFTNDEFMDQLLGTLATEPRGIGELIARPETWRSPGGEAPDLVERTPLPRIVRVLGRMRKDAAAPSTVPATKAELIATENSVTRTLPLKLYHPAHHRHYLVAANLVCGVGGFPDRAASREQVGFVIRRLLPSKSGTPTLEEFGFVKEAGGGRWQRVEPEPTAADPVGKLVDGEEMLPLFPINFIDATGQSRRLLTGVVPVGRREEYMGGRVLRGPVSGNGNGGNGGIAAVGAMPSGVTARKEQFKLDVSEPWKNLVRFAHTATTRIKETKDVDDILGKQHTDARKANEQAQAQSWLVLLDFADYLALHLPKVWARVLNPSSGEKLTDGEQKLFDWLDAGGTALGTGWQIAGPFAASLRDALSKVRPSDQQKADRLRQGLEQAVRPYPGNPGEGLEWPAFLYLLAGVRESVAAFGQSSFSPDGPFNALIPIPAAPDDPKEGDPKSPPIGEAEAKAALLDKLVQLVINAIDATAPATAAPPVPFAARLRDALAATNGDPGWFVLRCVFVHWECAPWHPPVLSPPSQRFQLASFFDSDAPARPIRIALPLDTTPAGMRKFNKNTAFIISDVLCGQLQRAKGLGLGDLVMSVLPWPFHKDLDVSGGGLGPCTTSGGASLGMICSLSIPIITICALILLMMIVLILDLIFRWIPWFIICFPIPGLKAKK